MSGTDYASDLLKGGRAAPASWTDYASDLLKRPAAPAAATAASPAPGAGLDTGALVDTVKDTPAHLARALRGFWQGATDIPVGLVQLASKLGPDKIDEAVGEYVRTRESDYQASRGDYGDRADLGRITGNVVASLPAGAGARAATLPARMAQGAKVGGALGLATPVNPDADSFALNKTLQVAGGAVTGALAVPVVEGLVRAAGATVNAVANMVKGLPTRLTNKATQDAVENTLTVELRKEGVDWTAIPKAARDALVLETQKSLKAGGQIDPAAVQRIADAAKLDIQLLRGQASRNPNEFATERNLGKLEVGAPIAQRLNDENTKLIAAVDGARADTGSVTRDAYDAGKSALGALKAEDEVQRKAVKTAYDAAKAKLGMDAEVPLQPVADRLGRVIDEVGAENIPAAVSSRLKEFGLLEGKQTKLFTIREAEKLRKLVGNNMPGQRTPQDAALTPLKQAIDDAVDSLATKGDIVGTEAATALEGARATAKERFTKIESIPLLADMLKKKTIPPEDVVNDYVIRGSVDNVKTLMGSLPPGPRRDVQAAVIDYIKSKAVNGSGETATFTQAGFNKALDDIGARNLDSIFEKTTAGNSVNMLELLRRIGRVAATIQKAPISSGVNYSSSATTIIDMLDKVGRLPVVGAIVGKPGDMVRATQVSRSLQPAAPTTPARPLLEVDFLDDLARTGSAAAPAIGAAIPMGLSRP